MHQICATLHIGISHTAFIMRKCMVKKSLTKGFKTSDISLTK